MNIVFRTAVTTAAMVLAAGASAAQRTATLEIRNVSCAACAPIVKSALSRLSGVNSVSVIERDGMATASVTFDDTKVTPESMTKATKSAGFPSSVKDVKLANSAEILKGATR